MEQLSLRPTNTEPERIPAPEVHVPRACAPPQERPLQREALTPKRVPLSPQLEKAEQTNKDPGQPKKIFLIIFVKKKIKDNYLFFKNSSRLPW